MTGRSFWRTASRVLLSSPHAQGALRGPASLRSTTGLIHSLSGLIKQTHGSRQNQEAGPGPGGLARSLYKREA